MIPARGDEACLRPPAHGEGFTAVEHPGEVDAVIELRSEGGDLRVVEVGPGGEDAAEKDGCVDRGHFYVYEGLAGFYVVEVVEEAMLVGHLVEMKVERSDDLLLDAIGGEVAALVGDAECGEAEASGGDAGSKVSVEFAGGGLVGCAVENLAGRGIGLLGEVETAGSLQLFQEGEVFVAEEPGVSWRCGCCLLRYERRGNETGSDSSAEQLCGPASRDFWRSRRAKTHSLSIVRSCRYRFI